MKYASRSLLFQCLISFLIGIGCMLLLLMVFFISSFGLHLLLNALPLIDREKWILEDALMILFYVFCCFFSVKKSHAILLKYVSFEKAALKCFLANPLLPLILMCYVDEWFISSYSRPASCADLLIVGSGVISWLGLYFLFHRKKREYLCDYPICQSCGYNLTGNVSGRCPECGTESHVRTDTTNANTIQQ